jgi:hypothetical protein
MKSEPELTAFLLSLANDMRRHKGDKALSDLPVSVPQEPEECIIANAFNYGCYVEPTGKGCGTIRFQTQLDRDTYLKVMKIDVEQDYPDWAEEFPNKEGAWEASNAAPLTKELDEIACAFDEGMLFQKYSRYAINEAEYEREQAGLIY